MTDVDETQQADSAGDCVVGVDFRYVELILIIATKQQAQVQANFTYEKVWIEPFPPTNQLVKKTTIRHAQSDK